MAVIIKTFLSVQYKAFNLGLFKKIFCKQNKENYDFS